MNLETEWLSSLLSEKTRWHHRNAMKNFKEFMGMSTKEILAYRKKEPHFETKVIQYLQWLMKKGLSQNSAISSIIGLRSFFSYNDCPLKLRNKIPTISMKLEQYKPSPQDIQALFKFGSLELKAYLSLMRDVPLRISDVLELVKMDLKEEMMFKSGKEGIVGKCYITPGTLDLLKRAKLPSTSKGIAKMLLKGCEIAQIHAINPHLLRKWWISKALDLGLSDIVVKILSFKSVEQSMLTYWLSRDDLREKWQTVINALPLENQVNGRIGKVQDDMSILMRALGRLIMEQKQLEGISLLDDNSTMEFLRSYAVYGELTPKKQKKKKKEDKGMPRPLG